MSSPLISIVCRTKDRPVFLLRALASIGAQTLRDFVVVLVNDGGDPGVVSEALAACDIDSAQVVRCDHDRPLGRVGALIAGFEATSTPLIAIHDDDDTWEPTFLETAAGYLKEHADVGAAFVRTDIIRERVVDGVIVEEARVPVWPEITRISLARLAEENQGVPISALYRRASLHQCGGLCPDLPVVEDWDLHVRLVAAGEVGFIDAASPLAHWHQRPDARGDEGNSTLAMADSHLHYDQWLRDQHLREWVNTPGSHNEGLLLYLGARFGEERRRYEDLVSRLERVEELARSVDAKAARVAQVDDRLIAAAERIDAGVARLNRGLDKAATPVRLLRQIRRR